MRLEAARFGFRRSNMIRGLGVLALVLSSPALFAQGNAVIFGSVTDPSGANVAQVAVTATKEATGLTESVKSNEAGNYIFPDLRPGSYRVTGQAAGFDTIERSHVLVEIEQRLRVDLSMRVGEVKQVMEVAGSVTTVDTLTSTVKDVVDSHRMDDL